MASGPFSSVRSGRQQQQQGRWPPLSGCLPGDTPSSPLMFARTAPAGRLLAKPHGGCHLCPARPARSCPTQGGRAAGPARLSPTRHLNKQLGAVCLYTGGGGRGGCSLLSSEASAHGEKQALAGGSAGVNSVQEAGRTAGVPRTVVQPADSGSQKVAASMRPDKADGVRTLRHSACAELSQLEV